MEAQILLLHFGVHIRSCDFRSSFSPIFRSCYDLIFPEFGLIPSNDFWGVDS
jgi:hypothetical protein